MPLLSVITVALNDAPSLSRTAESLASQDFSDFEWLVKDGGSSDGTKELLTYVQPRPVWIDSSSDQGLYNAMNVALTQATGTWVLFLNAGDRLCQPNTLSMVAPVLEMTNAGWAFGAVRNVDASGRPIGFQNASPFNPSGLASGNTTVPHQATFMRRDLLNDLGGFRTDFGTEADQELIYRASKRGLPAELVWPIAEFEVGGRGMQRPAGHFPKAMRRARKEQRDPLFGNSLLDAATTGVLVAKAHVSNWQAKILLRLGRAAD